MEFRRVLFRSDGNVADLGEIIREAVELATPSLQAHHITVRINRPDQPIELSVDARLLQRVILNLVLNAADAIGEAAVSNGVIQIRSEQRAAQTSIIVEDNGPGIPAEVLERIFNPFFTTKHSGT